MNERIKEIAQQCTYEYDDDFGKPHNDFDYEKFAELTIEECTKFLDERSDHDYFVAKVAPLLGKPQ